MRTNVKYEEFFQIAMKSVIFSFLALTLLTLTACDPQSASQNATAIPSSTPTSAFPFELAQLDCSGLEKVVDQMPEVGNPFLPGRRSFDLLISPDMKWITSFHPEADEPRVILTSTSNSHVQVINKPNRQVGKEQNFISWSPDSSAFAETAYPDNSKISAFFFTQLIIYRFSKDQKTLIPYIFDLPHGEAFMYAEIAWSPDSQEIALLTSDAIYFLDNQANLERTIQLPREDQPTEYYINDPSFWEHGNLLYIRRMTNKGSGDRDSFELRQTNINNLDFDDLLLTNDWGFSIFGATKEFLLVGDNKNNWEFDLLLINRTNFQIAQKFHFQIDNLYVIIHQPLPNSPSILFSIEGNADDGQPREYVWFFDWTTLSLKEVKINQPWVEALSWRPVVGDAGFFTMNESQCKFWMLP